MHAWHPLKLSYVDLTGRRVFSERKTSALQHLLFLSWKELVVYNIVKIKGLKMDGQFQIGRFTKRKQHIYERSRPCSISQWYCKHVRNVLGEEMIWESRPCSVQVSYLLSGTSYESQLLSECNARFSPSLAGSYIGGFTQPTVYGWRSIHISNNNIISQSRFDSNLNLTT